MKQALVSLTQQLIAYQSITPDDADCQSLLKQRLQALGFDITDLPSGRVSNFWAQRGTAKPLVVFAGHTDVVDVGKEDHWSHPPFAATIHEGMLFGRGAADMKGGLAAMIVATEHFLQQHPKHPGSIGFLITSGEEGDDFDDGTPKVLEYLKSINTQIDYCVLGEPTSQTQIGDMIKVGRRGSLTAKLLIKGKQGHVAYPHLALNPIHLAAEAIAKLVAIEWDEGNEFFPKTTMQFTNVTAGHGHGNVIPGVFAADFNFRFSPELTSQQIQQHVISTLDALNLDYQLTWRLNGEPFLTQPGTLTQKAQAVIKALTGLDPELSTTGGSSDGRFIAPTGAEIIELGLCNKTIHQIDEHVAISDLEQLAQIYQALLDALIHSA